MHKIVPLVIFLGLFAAGCGDPFLPAITERPGDVERHGEIVWRDLITADPMTSANFYSNLFGWQIDRFNDAKPEYYRIRNRGKLIGGIFKFSDGKAVQGNEWLSYISVDSPQGAVALVKDKGGAVMIEPRIVEGRGEMAVGADPSGGIIAVMNARGGDPAATEVNHNDWLWSELWSDDPGSVQAFYESLGYSFKKEKDDGKDYWVMMSDGNPVAAIINNPFDNVRSTWIPYIRVEDPVAISQKAVSLGGTAVMEPRSDVRGGTVAILMDPLGAPFVVQKWDK